MAKSKKSPDLGEKQLCPECEKKFYDLTKRPAVCPYCGTSFDPATIAVAPVVVPVKATPKKDDADDADIDPEDTDPEDIDPEDIDPEDIDQDEVVAKELELDGDASFGGSGGEEGDDDLGSDAPDMDGFSTSDDESVVDNDDDEQDILPPTGNEDDVEEEDA